jgi:hypothetical protein
MKQICYKDGTEVQVGDQVIWGDRRYVTRGKERKFGLLMRLGEVVALGPQSDMFSIGRAEDSVQVAYPDIVELKVDPYALDGRARAQITIVHRSKNDGITLPIPVAGVSDDIAVFGAIASVRAAGLTRLTGVSEVFKADDKATTFGLEGESQC